MADYIQHQEHQEEEIKFDENEGVSESTEDEGDSTNDTKNNILNLRCILDENGKVVLSQQISEKLCIIDNKTYEKSYIPVKLGTQYQCTNIPSLLSDEEKNEKLLQYQNYSPTLIYEPAQTIPAHSAEGSLYI